MAVLPLWILFFITTKNLQAIKIEETSNRTGIVFTETANAKISYDNWKLGYYYNLNAFLEQAASLENNIDQLKKICESIDDKNTCLSMIITLDEALTEITIDKNIINSLNVKPREKRGTFDFIGKLQNSMFGVMDAEHAREYDRIINSLQKGLINTNMFNERQLLLINETAAVNKLSVNELQTNLESLEERISEFFEIKNSSNNKYTEVWLQRNFETIFQLTKSILDNQFRLSKHIKDILSNAAQGKIIELIPISTFEENLAKINSVLTSDKSLPIEFSDRYYYDIFKILKTQYSITGNNLIIEICIPIVEKRNFKLFKAIPVPTIVNFDMILIEPESKYFLINDHVQYIIPLSDDEKSQCIEVNKENIICFPFAPINQNTNSCEFNIYYKSNVDSVIFQNKCSVKRIPKINYVTNLDSGKSFYLTVASPTTIKYTCSNGNSKEISLRRSAILSLDNECRIDVNNMIIKPRIEHFFGNIQILNNKNITHINKPISIEEINIFKNKKFADKSSLYNDLENNINKQLFEENEEFAYTEFNFDKSTKNMNKWITFIFIIGIIVIILVTCEKICKSLDIISKINIAPLLNLFRRQIQ